MAVYTESRDKLHDPCKDWRELISYAREDLGRTASKRRRAHLEKLIRVCRQLVSEGFPCPANGQSE